MRWESANNPLNNVDRWIESHRLETWQVARLASQRGFQRSTLKARCIPSVLLFFFFGRFCLCIEQRASGTWTKPLWCCFFDAPIRIRIWPENPIVVVYRIQLIKKKDQKKITLPPNLFHTTFPSAPRPPSKHLRATSTPDLRHGCGRPTHTPVQRERAIVNSKISLTLYPARHGRIRLPSFVRCPQRHGILDTTAAFESFSCSRWTDSFLGTAA